jgi:uncharacterized membrane protein
VVSQWQLAGQTNVGIPGKTMDSMDDVTLETRVARLEGAVAAIGAKLDAIGRADVAEPRAPEGAAVPWMPSPRSRPHDPRRRAQQAARPNPLGGRSVEWWLARGGALLTCVAVILLYQYAVERNWITPLVRVIMGATIGLALLVSGFRLPQRDSAVAADPIGLREVLLGAGLSAWYITAYAAAVFYQLIPMSAARLLFLALSVTGVWLALREKRAILAFLALGVGFSTPLLLPSTNPSVPAFAMYLATLIALGSVVYLMRGWQSILWLTFVSAWLSAGSATSLVCCENANTLIHIEGSPEMARLAMALLIVFAGATLARVPSLRRRLLATASDLYTSDPRPQTFESVVADMSGIVQWISGRPAVFDSPVVWVITLFSPIVALMQLSAVWPSASGIIWGTIMLLPAAFAYRLASSASDPDEELTHVEAAAAALWSLAAAFWIADGSGSRAFSSFNATLTALTLHAFLLLYYLRSSRFAVVRRIALLTAGACLGVVILRELSLSSGAERQLSIDPGWTFAELGVVAACAWVWWTLQHETLNLIGARFLGIMTYLALMLADARILGFIWPPLVTLSYAFAGAGILILGRSKSSSRFLRRVGASTLVVVVARLLFVDLAGVETIWRVLLFLGCGALFLFTSHRLQTAEETTSPEAAG